MVHPLRLAIETGADSIANALFQHVTFAREVVSQISFGHYLAQSSTLLKGALEYAPHLIGYRDIQIMLEQFKEHGKREEDALLKKSVTFRKHFRALPYQSKLGIYMTYGQTNTRYDENDPMTIFFLGHMAKNYVSSLDAKFDPSIVNKVDEFELELFLLNEDPRFISDFLEKCKEDSPEDQPIVRFGQKLLEHDLCKDMISSGALRKQD